MTTEPAATGTTRPDPGPRPSLRRFARRRPLLTASLLAMLLATIGLGWGVTWALTAQPVGTVDLDRTLADVAAWPGADRDASSAAWATVLATLDDGRRTLRDADTVSGITPDQLVASPDFYFVPIDSPLWEPAVSGTTAEALRAQVRTGYDARLDALESDGVLDTLAALARGPRPAPSAADFRSMGLGTTDAVTFMLPRYSESRRLVQHVALSARRHARDGDLDGLIRDLDAMEGLARGTEATGHMVGQLTADALRRLVDGTLRRIIADAWLSPAGATRVATWLRAQRDEREGIDRTERVIETERVLGHAYLDQSFDAAGRFLPAYVGGGGPAPLSAISRLRNVPGLVMVRRKAVQARYDAVLDGTPLPRDGRSGGLGLFDAPFELVDGSGKSVRDFRETRRRMEAHRRLALVMVEIARVEAEQGAPPASLDALGLPEAELADPFGATQLRYERMDTASDDRDGDAATGSATRPVRWRLWSIGVNETDDGGTWVARDAADDIVIDGGGDP